MTRLASLIAISALALGCSSSSSTTPTDVQYDDTAQAIGSTASTGSGGGETGSISDVIALAAGGSVNGFMPSGSGSVTGTHAGLDYSYTLTCKDSGGTCTGSTASAEATVDWAGNLTVANLTTSVSRSSDWRIGGLQGDTVSITGTGTLTLGATVQSVFRPLTTSYTLTSQAAYNEVAVDRATGVERGGDITYSIAGATVTTKTTSGSDASDTFDIGAKLSFATDGTATLVLDGSRSYTVNMQTGAVVKIGA